jgi:type I restriction enzyme S subunit
MGSKWRESSWGEIVTLEYGKGLRDYRVEKGMYRVFGTNGPIGWYDRPICTHPGVVVGRKGAYRGIHYSPEPFFVIDTAFYLEPKIQIDMRWAYYCLLTYDINGMDSGSAIPSTSRDAFYRLPVSIPSLSEQRAIACILGALDDKIDLNRRMNRTLEAMARALFQSWFVDFDPVRAKLAGQAPAGLRPEIAALFPDRLVEVEGREAPEGWGSGRVQDMALLNPESWTKNTRPDVINYVDLSNTKWGRIEAVTVYPQQDAPSRAQRILRLTDTIVGVVRPGNGSYAYVSKTGLTGSTGFAVLRPQKPTFAEFVYLAVTSKDNIDTLAHLADGAAYPAVRPEIVGATPIVKPASDVLHVFSRLTCSMLKKIEWNERESLAALRDTLLPKLISGALRVADAERIVERCV